MKKNLKDWIVPWLYTSREYNVGILDKAMANPGHARLMLNENPIQPSEKVIEAAVEALRHGNWYPDSFLSLRTKSVRCTIWARTMSRCATDLRTPSTP